MALDLLVQPIDLAGLQSARKKLETENSSPAKSDRTYDRGNERSETLTPGKLCSHARHCFASSRWDLRRTSYGSSTPLQRLTLDPQV